MYMYILIHYVIIITTSVNYDQNIAGKCTEEYKKVRSNLSDIVRALQLTPSAKQTLCLKFKEREWLDLPADPTEERLVTQALGRIELDVNQFEVFIKMLDDIKGMDQIVLNLAIAGKVVQHSYIHVCI